MRRLALSDEILLSIDKPARYIGNKVMREKKIPLFALESQEPVRSFDFLGITIQYEMCYTNILQIMDLSGITLHAADRGEDEPIVIGGGPCTYNPEPIAEFFDLFYIGEGEVAYDELFNLYREKKSTGMSRRDFLLRASRIEGIYVPQFYSATYKEDGTLASFGPTVEGVPAKVRKRIVMDFNGVSYPEAPIVPYLQATQDRVVLEIQRGCIRGCRFCQAGMIYRPLREKNVERLKRQAEIMLKNTGYDEISLSSLSSSDYSELDELLTFLIQICKEKGINISLPSLRIDAFSLDVMSKVQDVKKSSLTFSAEAGSQRMRDVINKGITEADILNGALEAFRGGWNKVKLYFMLGLPGEKEEDVKDIAHLCEKVAECYYDNIPKEKRTGKVSINASSSFFVPKPFTPFQWARMDKEQEFLDKAHMVKDEVRAMLNQKSIRYTYHDAYISVLEGVLARGDRRVAQAIEKAYRKGAIFDAWSEYFDEERWQESFRECGMDPYFYTARERDTSELLPWDFLDCQVSRDFLIREWKRAKEGVVTPNCRQRCSGCGCRVYNGGVCYESQD